MHPSLALGDLNLDTPKANLDVGGTDPVLRAKEGYVDEPPEGSERQEWDEPQQPAVPVPVFTAETFAQGLVMADDARARRDSFMAERQAQEQRLARAFEPPPLPTGKELEALVVDEKALAAEFQKRDQHYKNAMLTGLGQVSEHFEARLAQVQHASNSQAFMAQRNQSMAEATALLEQRGVQNAAEVISAAEVQMRGSDPRNYWTAVRNPAALEIAGRVMAEQIAQERGLAPAAGIGYDPSSPARSRAGSGPTEAMLDRVGKLLGRTLSDEQRSRIREQGSFR